MTSTLLASLLDIFYLFLDFSVSLSWHTHFLSFFLFFFFQGCMCGKWKFTGCQGSNLSCSSWPTPQPQQRRIQAISASYTTAQGNARYLTHWARPGIEPASSWILVGFVASEPQRELHDIIFFIHAWKVSMSWYMKCSCLSLPSILANISRVFTVGQVIYQMLYIHYLIYPSQNP